MVRYNGPIHSMMKTWFGKIQTKANFASSHAFFFLFNKMRVKVLLWSWIENAFIGIIVFYPDIFDTTDVCIHLF